MRDKRRRGYKGGVIDQAVEQALEEALKGLSPKERRTFMIELRAKLGDLLSTAPLTAQDVIVDLTNRATLAAAFRVDLRDDD